MENIKKIRMNFSSSGSDNMGEMCLIAINVILKVWGIGNLLPYLWPVLEAVTFHMPPAVAVLGSVHHGVKSKAPTCIPLNCSQLGSNDDKILQTTRTLNKVHLLLFYLVNDIHFFRIILPERQAQCIECWIWNLRVRGLNPGIRYNKLPLLWLISDIAWSLIQLSFAGNCQLHAEKKGQYLCTQECWLGGAVSCSCSEFPSLALPCNLCGDIVMK